MPDLSREVEQAVATQLDAALERYEQQCAETARTWLDMEPHAGLNALVDEMRPCCACLPRLSVPWAAFLVTHSELVSCRWRAGSAHARCRELEACVRNHAAALHGLRQGCARLAAGERDAGPPPLPHWSERSC